MISTPSTNAHIALRLAIWFVFTLLFLGAAGRSLVAQIDLFGPTVVLSRSAWISYNVPAIILFILSLAPHFWPRPSRQMMVFGVFWFFLGGLVLLPIV